MVDPQMIGRAAGCVRLGSLSLPFFFLTWLHLVPLVIDRQMIGRIGCERLRSLSLLFFSSYLAAFGVADADGDGLAGDECQDSVPPVHGVW